MRNEELENLINLQDIKDGELERGFKEVNEQMMKLNRANSRIQFDLKQIDKNCDPNKRSTLELIKVIIFNNNEKYNNNTSNYILYNIY